jgi:D-specific alpha-keto acid dehydrogenase
MPLPGRAAAGGLPPASSAAGPGPGVTAYGCRPDEARIFRELAPRLGLTATLTEAAVTEATAGLASGNRCVSVSHRTPLPGATLVELARVGVEFVSTRSIGRNHVDVACAESLGIVVENVAYSPGSVADYTLMLILMLARDARSVLSRSLGHDYRLNDSPGRELGDLTVGVVGTGRIGTAVIDRLRGFGCRILAHDLRPALHVPDAAQVPLEELLERSDVVTLHTPLTAATHHLLGHRRIGRMKPGAHLVNTGRGALVDTGALVCALERGRLGGAALDVLEEEEGIFYADRSSAPVASPLVLRLQALPNVIVSPHTAYFTERAVRDMVTNSLTSCLDFESRNHA